MKLVGGAQTPPALIHWLAWAAFLFCSVYGHVALKVAVDARSAESANGLRGVVNAVINPWGASAILAWGLSAVLWIVVLARHSLLEANAISALSYALISLAAWRFLAEPLGRYRLLGVALITIGIYLVKGSK